MAVECSKCPLYNYTTGECRGKLKNTFLTINNQTQVVGAYPINCHIAIQKFRGIRGYDNSEVPYSTKQH